MDSKLRASFIVVPLLAAVSAQAECFVSSDPGAVVRPLNAAVQADADVIVSMSLLPKLLHIEYSSAAKKLPCDLGPLKPDTNAYSLWGEDGVGRQRKALPARKGDPIAMVLPVADIAKAIEAAKQGRTAKTEGYLLATVSKTDFTGWRFYTAMPDAATLKADMTEALGGGTNPIFRKGDDNKVEIFVPKN